VLAVFGLALSGVLYSGYLTWVELVVLAAICLWCVASAVVITVITLLAAAMTLAAPSTRPTAPHPRIHNTPAASQSDRLPLLRGGSGPVAHPGDERSQQDRRWTDQIVGAATRCRTLLMYGGSTAGLVHHRRLFYAVAPSRRIDDVG
jgi:hypothetical protein